MNVVAYYRVSTARQGQSGLGLEAQRAIVEDFCRSRGHAVLEEFVEVQSGKDDARPTLQKALSAARLLKAGVIVAKLDRLARSASFLDRIVKGDVDVLFCNLPDLPPGPTGRFMLQLMASLAEMEAGIISERTKSALRAAKARGTKLGGFRGTAASPKAREASVEARRSKADEHALKVMEHVTAIRGMYADAPVSLEQIAGHLTGRGVSTATGKSAWSAMQVSRVIERAQAINDREIDAALERRKALAAL